VTLRSRIAIASGAIITAVVIALSLATFLTMSRQLIRQTDESLDARVSAIADTLRNSRQMNRMGQRVRNPLGEALLPTRFDTVTQVIDEFGSVVIGIGAVDLPVTDGDLRVARNPNGGYRRSTTTIDGTSYRTLTVPLAAGGALQLAKDIGEVERAREAIRNWTIGFALLGILAAVLSGWLIARRTARPIQQLAQAAEEVAATTNLDTTLTISGDAEVTRLVSSFNSMLAALRSSRDRQRQLIQDASHEIRTPLTSLRANSELLDRPDVPAEIKAGILRDMRTEIDELAELSSELTALAADQKTTESPTSVDLLEVAHEVADRARRRWGRDVVVAGSSTTFVLRRNQFERSLHNLVDNALKFSAAPSPVTVKVTNTGIAVTDHGPGIADADKAKIFDRFYRADATRGLPGSGLGLAIVKQFVDDHLATIKIEDGCDGGTVMRIDFPAIA
jgi:two-component system sensor histidine kinase MprB